MDANRERGRALRWIERGLILIGISCLGWWAAAFVQAAVYQREQAAILDRMMRTAVRPTGATPVVSVKPGGLVGEIEIPRLNLSSVVIEGDDDLSLKLAVGHLSDTPLPWMGGNSAFAGHRDTFFRPLKDLKVGDVIRFRSSRGEFDYRVQRTFIADPEEVWVLDPTPRPTLTLITCYPFSYLGNAPQRFIVRAERLPPISAALRNDSAAGN